MQVLRLHIVASALRVALLGLLSLVVVSCAIEDRDGPIEVGIIGEQASLFDEGVRLEAPAQYLRAATNEGLVALDPAGAIVPAIAERWHISPDGLYYTFRLRDGSWPDGAPLTADDVRIALRDALSRRKGTALSFDLAKLTEIKAMTGRVIELRLTSPMPEFLRLLAQPEMGLVKDGSGSGPMVMSVDDDLSLIRMSALPPDSRGLPARDDWEDSSRLLTVRALPAKSAVEAFADGKLDLLLNGQLADLPLADLGPLSRGTIQLDPVLGLFGLVILHQEGFLAQPENREALSMALDRTALIEPFSLGGWQSTTWIVPPSLFRRVSYPTSRWSELSLAERRETAAIRVGAWTTENDQEAQVRVSLPLGLGSDLLFEQLKLAWGTIGVEALRVPAGTDADLELRDLVARYSSPRWFLNQFNCELDRGLCSETADALISQSILEGEPDAKERLLAEAHEVLVADEVFIPLGAPVRWSLVRGAIGPYSPNRWGLHPLFPLSQVTS